MHMLGGSLDRIEKFYGLGVRYITMAHFTSNRFAVSSADSTKEHAELGALGFEAVEVMNELGMMIDVSHTHTDLIAEVCRLSSQPVIVSHGAASALRPTFRNLTDEDIKNIAGTGGVIGLTYCAEWLAPRRSKPHLSVVVDHADHIKGLVGIDHIALGSDWDGLITTPDGMRDATDLPALTQLFFDRGYDADEVEKILGINFMRVFRQVTETSSSQ
jgi:membrane dipeptidase